MRITALPQAKGFRPIKACASCGECCKRSPGIYHPTDFKSITVDALAAAMIAGTVAVDWWEGDPRGEGQKNEVSSAYFLRPPTIKPRDPLSPRDPSWGGQCALLTETGCSLSYARRPAECRRLKPDRSRQCILPGGAYDPYAKRQSAVAWLPYASVIDAAADKAEIAMRGAA